MAWFFSNKVKKMCQTTKDRAVQKKSILTQKRRIPVSWYALYIWVEIAFCLIKDIYITNSMWIAKAKQQSYWKKWQKMCHTRKSWTIQIKRNLTQKRIIPIYTIWQNSKQQLRQHRSKNEESRKCLDFQINWILTKKKENSYFLLFI